MRIYKIKSKFMYKVFAIFSFFTICLYSNLIYANNLKNLEKEILSLKDINDSLKTSALDENLLPDKPFDVINFLIISLAIILTILIIRFVLKKFVFRKKELSCFEKAQINLAEIKALVEEDSLNLFTQKASLCLKEYLHCQYNIKALELTNDEFLPLVEKDEFLGTFLYKEISELLLLFDEYKFTNKEFSLNQKQVAYLKIKDILEKSNLHILSILKKNKK